MAAEIQIEWSRRILYILVFAAVIFPLVMGWEMSMKVSPHTKGLYDAIEKLEPGDVVILSFDYDASTYVEQFPQSVAIWEHLRRKDARIIAVAFWLQGVPWIENTIREVYGLNKTEPVDELPDYGKKFVNIGWIPGGEVGMARLGENVAGIKEQDNYGNMLKDMPIFEGVKDAHDVKLIVSFSSGTPGAEELLRQIGVPYNVTMGTAVTAVSAPGFYPYYPKYFVGILGGLRGAAEYELLVERKGLGMAGMVAQSFVHGLIIIFIVIGNIQYLLERRRQEEERRRESGGA
ncbi:hypothetical protein DRN46_05730 [Thermococci archaeon]|nr:MAG: hypothetical protein DRN46_05730 [Thermococci archaeon]